VLVPGRGEPHLRLPTFRHDHVLAGGSAIEPLAEVLSELTNADFHSHI
jgi:hypothetical protein